ncbi:hypothetical protein MAC3UK_0023 [Bdellovibrio phage MAC3UK]|nr:hypothetical protein MAC3UK_0023 [Bdellovibrio phage MAC3UK]
MIFKIYNCDFGMKIGGVNYDYEHVVELQIEDNERNRLTRGANASNKIGLSYKEGMRDPKRWTLPILNMTGALKGVLDAAFDNQTRIEVYAIDRASGSSKMARSAILSNKPQQLTLDDSADSMQVSLEFETFDSSETHKE